jgi:hypothetical protein
MSDQLLIILAMLLVTAGAIVGASYVFAITAEREPEHHQPSRSASLR